MKIVVITDTGREIATFEHAEDTDYLDYSAELDAAVAQAIRAEGHQLPNWLTGSRAGRS